LLAALDDPNEDVRLVAESLLEWPSSRHKQTCRNNGSAEW
jgi:hypothetical protein